MAAQRFRPVHQGVMLFTKTPGCLPIKTRLAESIGREKAEALYSCFLSDISAKINRLNIPLLVYHLPGQPAEKVVLSRYLGMVSGYFFQTGNELGSRMQNAFATGFAAGWERLLLIGGDCPDLPPQMIVQAFELLEDFDCVVGPTVDGGYYLIGFHGDSFFSDVFDFADWGTSTVYGETLRRLRSAGVSYSELPQWEDVDTLAELRRLFLRHHQDPSDWFCTSKTFQLLKTIWPTG